MSVRYLVVGGSKGLGSAFVAGLPRPGDVCWTVSRSAPTIADGAGGVDHRWIQADAAQPDFATRIAKQVNEDAIDCLIYNAGVWEAGSIFDTSDNDICNIVQVNLTSCILTLKHLAANVVASSRRQVVLVGSTCGLENEGSRKVAYVASKFGLRGVAHAFREEVRAQQVKVTIVSPGSIASDVPYGDGVAAALDQHHGQRIPVADFVATIRWLLQLSPAAAPKEIDLPALGDDDV